MTNIINVILDGVGYTGFTRVNIHRSIDTIAGVFRIDTVVENVKDYPVKLGQRVQITVNGFQVIDGFVEKLEVNYSASSGAVFHAIAAQGRDKTCDVIDSTLDGQVTFSGTMTFENLIKNTLKKAGISGIGVVNNAGTIEPFPKSYILSSSVGESIFSFIEGLARLRNVMLTTDGLGNIVITRASQTDSGATLINTIQEANKSNIKVAAASFDNSQRYNKYKAFSQAQTSSIDYETDNVDDIVNISGEATDSTIRAGRNYNFIAEQNSNKSECKDRATWERNVRYGPSIVYDCTVFGFNNTPSSIWAPNQLVRIVDEFANINSIMIVDVVEFSQDLSDGSLTKLKCIDKDAFTAKQNLSSKEQQTKVQGEDFGSTTEYK